MSVTTEPSGKEGLVGHSTGKNIYQRGQLCLARKMRKIRVFDSSSIRKLMYDNEEDSVHKMLAL